MTTFEQGKVDLAREIVCEYHKTQLPEKLYIKLCELADTKESQTPQATSFQSEQLKACVPESHEENSDVGSVQRATKPEAENRDTSFLEEKSLQQVTKIVGSKKPDDSFSEDDEEIMLCMYGEEEKPKLEPMYRKLRVGTRLEGYTKESVDKLVEWYEEMLR